MQLQSLNDIPIFVLHLERAIERIPTIQALEAVFHRPLIVMKAIDGTDPTNDVVVRHPRTHPYFKTDIEIGNVGCLLSHIQMYRTAVSQNIQCIGLLEDDAECRVPIEPITEFVRSLPHWDILFLGATEWVNPLPLLLNTVRVERFWGTHAYLITRHTAEVVLADYEEITRAGRAYPIDWLLAYSIQKHGLRAFGPLQPKQFFQQVPGFTSYITGKKRT